MDLKNSQQSKIRMKQEKVKKELQDEYACQMDSLKQRDDFEPGFEYFLDILTLLIFPAKLKDRMQAPLAGLYCIQAPLELFHALGFHPVRFCHGSLALQKLSAASLPALACPMIKSCLGSFLSEESLEKICDVLIVPTTCDWNTKIPELIGANLRSPYVMELPHLKDSARGKKRWQEEIHELKNYLQKISGRKLERQRLWTSVQTYMRAWEVLGRILELRRNQQLSGTWSLILTNAFLVDKVENWTENVQHFLKKHQPRPNSDPAVFLAGSPVFFPYLKITELIEEAGMFIKADELCTSERILASSVPDDLSEYGLLKALADKCHRGCSCPTYADNHRRINTVMHAMRKSNIKGVVYHVLKGCHPYDIESFVFEKTVKENGFHFLKIETGYSKEDRQNILARLEAFKDTIG